MRDYTLKLTRFERFNSDGSGIIPEAFPDLAELAVAEFAHEFQRGPINLPLVSSIVRHASRHRFLDLERYSSK